MLQKCFRKCASVATHLPVSRAFDEPYAYGCASLWPVAHQNGRTGLTHSQRAPKSGDTPWPQTQMHWASANFPSFLGHIMSPALPQTWGGKLLHVAAACSEPQVPIPGIPVLARSIIAWHPTAWHPTAWSPSEPWHPHPPPHSPTPLTVG